MKHNGHENSKTRLIVLVLAALMLADAVLTYVADTTIIDQFKH